MDILKQIGVWPVICCFTYYTYKSPIMKNSILSILLLSGVISSCNNNSDTTKVDSKDSTMTTVSSMDSLKKDSSSTVNNTTSNASQAPADENTIKFVQKAASGGMMEVELGKLAQQKGLNQRVKDFGSMLNTDHTNANNELKSIATSKNITIPSSMNAEDQKHVDMLSSKSGVAFDKAYIGMMVEDHKGDIKDFKKASENLKDADIKNFAMKTLPTLQKHLDSANAIHHKM